MAAHDQGAYVTYLGPTGSHIGHKESIKNSARVLGRIYDEIEYRGFGQKDAEVLAEGLEGADFVYTDVWVSMGEAESVWEERIARLSPYRVTTEVMAKTGMPMPNSCIACPPSTTARRKWARRRSRNTESRAWR